jgi:hypothetical protein
MIYKAEFNTGNGRNQEVRSRRRPAAPSVPRELLTFDFWNYKVLVIFLADRLESVKKKSRFIISYFIKQYYHRIIERNNRNQSWN